MLLSLCIPTYNRAEILDKSLSEITSNEAFDDDVEIVISDNCSTDNTENVAKKYTSRFSNIKYFKNEENLRDKNFWLALNRGTGEYLKLHNDYQKFADDGLKLLKDRLRQYHKKQIFFTSGNITTFKNVKTIECQGLDDFIKYVCTCATFIPTFGIWRENLYLIEEPLEKFELKLMQQDWSYQIVSKLKEFVIVNELTFCDSVRLQRKGYNWFKVHVGNYYEIMLPYVKKGLVSKQTYHKDISNVLHRFKNQLIYTFLYTPCDYQLEKKGSFFVLLKYCYLSPVFWEYIFLFPFFRIWFPLVNPMLKSAVKKNFSKLFYFLKQFKNRK